MSAAGNGHAHPGRAERIAAGRAVRNEVPLDAHAATGVEAGRDPIALLMGQAESRVPELVPVRHARMAVSPFTYFRGAALPMAADLAEAPRSDLEVQLCGDAHLSNFGAFASPERRLVFDCNDFDETLPGPFEWDVKRLAASLAVAARDNGFKRKARKEIVRSGVEAYRKNIRTFAEQGVLAVWYAHLDVESTIGRFREQIRPKAYSEATSVLAKARGKDSRQALTKLTTVVDGRRRIISQPPTIVPIEEVFSGLEVDIVYELLGSVVQSYQRSLPTDRRHLLGEFELVQVARKVVGVGSVGTRAWIVLLETSDGEPLFLQAKEAQKSVLARYAGASRFRNQGERVVAGQHLMQALSDIFLGWTRVKAPDGATRDFYVRQLRDWKFSAPIERMRPEGLALYARMCGWTLARAHARSGDPVAIGAYLGGSDRFDKAIVEYAEDYADQNELDYVAFRDHVKDQLVGVSPN
ncbi:hypothetical protein Ais01nite_44430 [Asanoa ishikariensis]|uniref:Uncharacterized conserved protein, DUF2252 family n=1 Tax=Asanoa ishikariensis TaxID=137265 RepID=A0A1H3S6G5_9ACTN|nr:DUF2252 domain-containing protein [Asanoa ishikariensis]GIF66408.1 hypothetical protein Ais01nite_44430 [Asanoa ishikariensis]SDZ33713.1 Uncharacterized conserved protein, DUF2252 family [Asanoa ishikariensis]